MDIHTWVDPRNTIYFDTFLVTLSECQVFLLVSEYFPLSDNPISVSGM